MTDDNLYERIRSRFEPLGDIDPHSAETKSLHPGSFVRAEIEARGLSVSQAAEALRVLRPTLSALLNGRASLSPEMALRLQKAFGLSMDRSCTCNATTTSPRRSCARPV